MPPDVAILVAEKPQDSVDTLIEAHRNLGHSVRVVHLSEVVITSGRSVRFPGHIPDVAHSRASALWGLAVQEAIEELVHVVNTSFGQRAGRDKWVCAQRLTATEVACVPTMLATPGLAAERVCEALGDDVVVKPLAGFGGRGVERRRGRLDMESALSDTGAGQLRVIQPYHHVGGRDLRVMVVDGRVVAAVERQARPGEFRSNVSLGASVRPVRIDRQVEALAIHAAQACSLDMAGVDIIETSDGPLVIEVNTNAGGLEEVRAVTGVDVATAMAAYVASKSLFRP
jgi:ribosomal protein S6--L-glutamate ligase